ncbi:MAG: SIMPL domain-containing protein [Rhodospirillales bacterium]|nr:SIMPL domain-containing protein [Alphaproteobacteria bacterium]MCB9986542.1 SIMPL domain-containing protein [Rhodospirillales bacterium]USO06922.1 MAG: SIMPL domain-containing protein [Rhodospirillales bacterium]
MTEASSSSSCCRPGALHLLAALLLALGLGGAGYAVMKGLVHLRGGERSVTVRGLSEQDVRADLAIWPVQYTVTDNDLGVAQKALDDQGQKIEAFLKAQGLPANAVRVQKVEVTDLLAQQYRPDNIQNGRYLLTKTYMVRTTDVDLVDKIARNVGELIAQGVILAPGSGPSYIFTKLNDIKPDMIARATESAREGARKFAEDSGARVGGIRTATQGLFQISARDDDNSPETAVIDKRVRVVTTVEYDLE